VIGKLHDEQLRKLKLERAQEKKWKKLQKEEVSISIAVWNVNGLACKANEQIIANQLASIEPTPDVTMLQETHL
jgi:hypothetical protein